MWVERGSVAGTSSPVTLAKGVEEFAKDCPAVYEYLTMDRYPDGGERQVATLIIFLEEGRWKGCLSDRESDRTLWKTADTIEDMLLEMDADIQEGGTGFRRSTQRKGKGGRKLS